MYTIKQRVLGGYTETVLSDGVSGASVSIFPKLGAGLNQLLLEKKGTIHPLLLSTQHQKDITEFYIPYYAGANLFPFPNRIANGSYEYNKENYQLECNDIPPLTNALHGLIFNKTFKEIKRETSIDSATIEYGYSNETFLKGYPFLFEITIQYTLKKNELTVTTTIINTGNTALPFGIGAHPYIATGTPIDKLKMKIPSSNYYDINASYIPNGKLKKDITFEQLNIIDKTRFDHCYKINNRSSIAETIIIDPIKDLKISIWQENTENTYNYVQYYTLENRKGIAVEPMTCPPDAFNSKIGLQQLLPKERYQCSFGITLR